MKKISNEKLRSLEINEKGYYWQGYNNFLKDRSSTVIRLNLDEETNKILSFMPDPEQKKLPRLWDGYRRCTIWKDSKLFCFN